MNKSNIKWSLTQLGWNSEFDMHFKSYALQGYEVGRVVSEQKQLYRLLTEDGEVLAQVSGKMRFQATAREDFPAVGDWVIISLHDGGERASIHGMLPRQSKFARKTAGTETEEQIIAANIDTVFLVNALNYDFNVRRMERYLTLAWDSGANPVIVLSKADLCTEVAARLAEVKEIALGVPVHVISSLTGEGLNQLVAYLQVGKTIAMLGSSGAGKSTMLNFFYGHDIQRVQAVRQGDDRGRHTTTSRELVILPQGGLIIDTPGMRELQLWGSVSGLQDSFGDVEELARQCRFSDCQHEQEPGCAVQSALQAGVMGQARFDNYLKLKKELAYLSRKVNQAEALAEKAKWKKIHQLQKTFKHR